MSQDSLFPPLKGPAVPPPPLKAVRRLLGISTAGVIAPDGTVCPIVSAYTHDGKIFITAKPGSENWRSWVELPPVPGTEGV